VTDFADLSAYQGIVDLATYAAAHDRVGLKLSEGASFVDVDFAARWQGAGQLGLARLAYHFMDADVDAASQAAHFAGELAAVGGLGPRDRPVVDAERGNGTAARDEVLALVGALAAGGYPSGILYASPSWLADTGLTAAMLPAGWQALWIADYGVTAPPIPAGWQAGQIVAWQYTDAGTAPGVPGPVDLSRVLNDWIGGAMVTDQSVQADIDTEMGKATAPGQTDGFETIRTTLVDVEADINVDQANAAALTRIETALATLAAGATATNLLGQVAACTDRALLGQVLAAASARLVQLG
jgi:GH25 family lysozyme M1 (1,4-beta-N-acetylmuramidase)